MPQPQKFSGNPYTTTTFSRIFTVHSRRLFTYEHFPITLPAYKFLALFLIVA
jgi:hypothetical protein